jgi:predicted DNA-binding transcriptional regulator AlpA
MVAKDRILRLPEVAEMTTLEPQTLYAMRSQGRGPKSSAICCRGSVSPKRVNWPTRHSGHGWIPTSGG